MRVAWILTLILLPLAGCLSDDGSETQSAPAPYGALPLPADLPAREAAAQAGPSAPGQTLWPTRDDWFVLPLEADPAGRVQAYTVTVPEGAAIDVGRSESAVLEVALLNEQELDGWILLVVDLDTERVVASAASAEHTVTTDGMQQGTQTQNVYDKPFYLYLGEDASTEGTPLGIVVGAAGNGTADFALRYLEDDPWGDGRYEAPSKSGRAFLREVRDTQAWLGTHAGQTMGFGLDLLIDVHSVGLMPHSVRVTAGQVDVQDDSEYVAGARVETVIGASSTRPAEEGFTAAFGYFQGGTHVGDFGLDIQARDAEPLTSEGGVYPTPFFMPYYAFVQADGPGNSSVQVSLDTAGTAAPYFEMLVLEHVTVSGSLETFFGIDLDDQRVAVGSDVPLARAQGDALVIEQGGAYHVLPGMAGPTLQALLA